jgi:DNA-binding protein HU-beta
MNKADLISQISEESGLTKTQANAALVAFTNAVTNSLKKGEKVTIVDFGTFSVFERAARKARNPRANTEVFVKAKKVAKFKAGKELSLSVS